MDSTLARVGGSLFAMPACLGRWVDMGNLENGRGTFSFLRQRMFVRPGIGDVIVLLLPNVRQTSDPNHGQLGNADFADGLSK